MLQLAVGIPILATVVAPVAGVGSALLPAFLDGVVLQGFRTGRNIATPNASKEREGESPKPGRPS